MTSIAELPVFFSHLMLNLTRVVNIARHIWLLQNSTSLSFQAQLTRLGLSSAFLLLILALFYGLSRVHDVHPRSGHFAHQFNFDLFQFGQLSFQFDVLCLQFSSSQMFFSVLDEALSILSASQQVFFHLSLLSFSRTFFILLDWSAVWDFYKRHKIWTQSSAWEWI